MFIVLYKVFKGWNWYVFDGKIGIEIGGLCENCKKFG